MNILKKDKTKEAALMSIGHFARTRVCFHIRDDVEADSIVFEYE